jgi:hypothetical protein
LSTRGVGEFVGQRLIGGTSSAKSAKLVSDLSRFGMHDLVKCQITRDTVFDRMERGQTDGRIVTGYRKG